MQITAEMWNQYISQMSKISQTAADKMQGWVDRHGFTDNNAMLNAAFALSEHYGSAIGALACQMYEATAAAQGVTVNPAEAAATPEYSEVAKAVNGAKKQSEKLVPSTVGRLVKQVGADTTLKNAQRDGAQFAWVPHGDSCAFCLMLASRGWQYMSKKALKNGHAEHIHANCDCQYAVRFDGKSTVEGYDPDKYREMYDNAEGNTPQEKLNSMRRAMAAEKKAVAENSESAIIKLPRAEEAVIPTAKFTEYALNPYKEPDKATAFELALGYNAENAEDLIKQIKTKLPDSAAKKKGNRGYGMTYEVIMDITGPNGKTAKVLTAWIDDSENGEMRLTTMHVD
ncbi:MAG: hypothetical protein LUF84_08430 [Clostridiales bacterium]|nr:hypothetical protein [Clostridiales bacterium]